MILCHRRKGSLNVALTAAASTHMHRTYRSSLGASHLPSHSGLPNSFATECRRLPEGMTPRESSHMKSRLQPQSSQKASSITTAWDEHSFPLHSRNPRNNCSANAEHPCQHHQRYLETGTRAAQVINRHTDRSRLKLVDPRGVWFTRLHRIPPSVDFNMRLTWDWTGPVSYTHLTLPTKA